VCAARNGEEQGERRLKDYLKVFAAVIAIAIIVGGGLRLAGVSLDRDAARATRACEDEVRLRLRLREGTFSGRKATQVVRRVGGGRRVAGTVVGLDAFGASVNATYDCNADELTAGGKTGWFVETLHIK
jgi:hypothetical protein